MKLLKLQGGESAPLPEKEFSDFQSVQGARMAQKDGVSYIASPRRFKLFCDAAQKIYILSGSGYIKWARGETPFSQGDCFLAEAIGEYELNGSCIFEKTEA